MPLLMHALQWTDAVGNPQAISIAEFLEPGGPGKYAGSCHAGRIPQPAKVAHHVP
jgi:hypothetical protein